MKKAIFVLLFGMFLTASACKHYPDEGGNPVDSTKDSTTVNYQITAAGMRPLRDSEQYVLWLKIAPDTSFQLLSVLSIRYFSPEDSAFLVGKFSMIKSLDSIREVVVSLEKTSTPSVIGLPLLHGTTFFFDSSKKNAGSILDSKGFLGDYSTLQGGLVFTSTSSDTTTYTREFYLMNYRSPAHNPSLLSLPSIPKGWEYGLWAVDSNFTPRQQFLYGLFSRDHGHDNDSVNDFFDFPGGRKAQRMDMPSGSIIVTLEPEFYGDSLKHIGPSPFTLLRFDRNRFIEKDVNYPMINVSSDGVPGGIITFRKN